jgi:[1-hydroxy-2-(trimethylamino)ethyl]phosphonate dioxygenase
MNAARVVDEIFTVFREKGHRNYGENVTELEHALQSATFAQRQGEEAQVVAASLLHDYGHLLHDLGEQIADHGIDARHEHIGANRLRRWFSDAVTAPIRLHADSKRYLCWKETEYFDGLSEASRKSLALQGGPMNDAEAAEFEKGEYYAAAVRVRRYDDQGKIPGMATPSLEDFRPLLEALVKTSNGDVIPSP